MGKPRRYATSQRALYCSYNTFPHHISLYFEGCSNVSACIQYFKLTVYMFREILLQHISLLSGVDVRQHFLLKSEQH